MSGDRIGQWARRGYIQSSQSTGRPRVYSYQDVAEAMVVHELTERADLKSIKRAIARLRERHGYDWPLQHSEVGAWQGAVVGFEHGVAYDIGGKGSPWQQVVEDENLRKIAGQLERGGWAVRELPDLRHIEVNPDRLSGRPVIRGRRVAASMVAELAAQPEGIAILHDDFDLNDAEIRDARRWWEVTARFDQAAA